MLLMQPPMFVGDSLMVHVGQRVPKNTVVVAKVGSGLANPKLKDWSKQPLHSGPTVIILGTNDGQNIKGHLCGSSVWQVEYRSRVGAFMSKGNPVNMLWLLPARTGRPKLDVNLDYVRQAISHEAQARGVATLDLRVILDEVSHHNPVYHSRDKIHLNAAGVARVRATIASWLSSKDTYVSPRLSSYCGNH